MPNRPSENSDLHQYLKYRVSQLCIKLDRDFIKRVFKYSLITHYREKIPKKHYNNKPDINSFLDKYHLEYSCVYLNNYIILTYESDYKLFRIIVSPNDVHYVIDNIWDLCKKIPTRDSRKNSYHILMNANEYTICKNGSQMR